MTDHWSAPPASSLPQPPSPPPPDNRRSKAIVGAAVAVLLAIAVGLTVGLLRDDDGPQLVGEETAAPPAPAGDAGAATDTLTSTWMILAFLRRTWIRSSTQAPK